METIGARKVWQADGLSSEDFSRSSENCDCTQGNGNWKGCPRPCVLKQMTLSEIEVRSLLCNKNVSKDKMCHSAFAFIERSWSPEPSSKRQSTKGRPSGVEEGRCNVGFKPRLRLGVCSNLQTKMSSW